MHRPALPHQQGKHVNPLPKSVTISDDRGFDDIDRDSDKIDRRSDNRQPANLGGMEPRAGFDPATSRLRGGCSWLTLPSTS